ncbi:MAG TPA: FAD-linked oxidase C-terminal domain-containing protein [Dissulfurispiraceae bacterium]|nr:FAD-linked oxidase C-terminal domain-containing protein [Dissulfurispiraceae bacterium]
MSSLFSLPGIDISTEPEDLICYSYDASIAAPSLPYAVAWPKSAADVSRLVRHAAEHEMAIIPRGAGTGMAGASIPTVTGTIVLSFERMRKILEIDTQNLQVVVEPGVVNAALQKELDYNGFFYPPDPASMAISTIGGNVATNAGGPRAVKYGVTRNYVMELEVVLADGTVLTVGGKMQKRVVGYSLKDLIVGSEGTLAIATRIRLRVLPQPEDLMTLLVVFKDLEAAGTAVPGIFAAKVIPRALEFIDRSAIDVVEKYRPTGLPAGSEALLLIELDGYPGTIRKEADRVASVCSVLGGEVTVAEDRFARERLWEARRALSPALKHMNRRKINEDIVVPVERLAFVLKELRRLSERSGIPIVSFGHAGDGNIHVNIMVEKESPDAYREGLDLVREVFSMAITAGGSISGEHGIGILKAPYIDMELKARELDIMRAIKRTFDPKNILNPGKVFSQAPRTFEDKDSQIPLFE